MSAYFSIDVNAFLDAPALIDRVLNATKQPNLHLIGMSKGTTVAMSLLSTRVEYNSKVRLLILMSPVTYIESPVLALSILIGVLKAFVYFVSPIMLLNFYRRVSRIV